MKVLAPMRKTVTADKALSEKMLKGTNPWMPMIYLVKTY